MGLQKQSCPICGAANPIETRVCAICGARLSGQADAAAGLEDHPTDFYDSTEGEDDLMTTHAPGGVAYAVMFMVIGAMVAGGVYLALTRLFNDSPDDLVLVEAVPTTSPTPDATQSMIALSPQPTLTPSVTRTAPPPLPTVTPTISPTPTEGACVQTVIEGDTLYGIALRCGHRDFSVVPVIVEFNNLACDTCIQIGQVIEVPRPTPTLDPTILADPNSLNPVDDVALTGDEGDAMPEGDTAAEDLIATRQVALEPTLDPNLQYHTIVKDQTLYDIVAIYNVDVKLLSEINPEIDFPQCDFGERFGGPTCSVFFTEGQRIRVPAPTPTPTIPPTASGSETPTPTATATINVPALFMPQDGAVFDAAAIITLRWTTTGTLARDEVYAVHVTNLDSGAMFTGITCDLAFDIPLEWQSDMHEYANYEWSVGVNTLSPFGGDDEPFYVQASGFEQCSLSYDAPVEWTSQVGGIPYMGMLSGSALANERYLTPKRRFTWQGRGS